MVVNCTCQRAADDYGDIPLGHRVSWQKPCSRLCLDGRGKTRLWLPAASGCCTVCVPCRCDGWWFSLPTANVRPVENWIRRRLNTRTMVDGWRRADGAVSFTYRYRILCVPTRAFPVFSRWNATPSGWILCSFRAVYGREERSTQNKTPG